MTFFSKKIPLFLLLILLFILTGCSQFNSEQTASITFRLAGRDVAEGSAQGQASQESQESQELPSGMLTVALKGGYEAEQTVSFKDEAVVTFEKVPVGVKIHVEASLYFDDKMTYAGSSDTFKVKTKNDITVELYKIFSVLFETNGGGTAPDEQRIVKGDVVTAPQAIPQKPAAEDTAYEFAGWFTSADGGTTLSETAYNFSTPVTADFTLYAKYIEKHIYTVTFNANGGTNAPDTQRVVEGELAQEPDQDEQPVKASTQDYAYTFAGWYTSNDNGATLAAAYNFETQITGDITLYAKWNSKPFFTVTFNANGGTNPPQSQRVLQGEKALSPAESELPVKAGNDAYEYAFDGWYTSADGGTTLSDAPYDFDTAVTGNLTLYAKWAALVQADIVDAKIRVDNVETINVTGPTDNNNGTYTFTADAGYDSYLWKFDGSDINPATNTSYSTTYTFTTPDMSSGPYSAPGTYSVTLLATKTVNSVIKYYSYTTQIIKD